MRRPKQRTESRERVVSGVSKWREERSGELWKESEPLSGHLRGFLHRETRSSLVRWSNANPRAEFSDLKESGKLLFGMLLQISLILTDAEGQTRGAISIMIISIPLQTRKKNAASNRVASIG